MSFSQLEMALMQQSTFRLQALRSLEARYASAVQTLRDIAAMGQKAGSESAKHRLRELGIDWETGEASPDYGSMT